ncbi:hypothetical protein CO666_30450 [Rhizobium chutanense]|uniref:Uncharacterized protein n=1 Tax=Rhizobium chutanense TaxID=2035448 RepID=A0A2A6J362_9HYPH|nr:hypothetical protein CO666_30450 [Rhizobium chutanense]
MANAGCCIAGFHFAALTSKETVPLAVEPIEIDGAACQLAGVTWVSMMIACRPSTGNTIADERNTITTCM